MTPSDAIPVAAPTVRSAGPARLDGSVAAVVLALAALLAIAGDALLKDGIVGIAFPVWTALVALTLVALAWRAELALTREAKMWLGVAVVSSIGLAWRDAEMLQFLDLVGTVGGLGLAAATINRPGSVLFAPHLTDVAQAILRTLRVAIPGIVPLAFSEAPSRMDSRRFESRAFVFGRIALIVVPLLLIFGGLLRSADPIFASLTSIPAIDAELVFQHAVVIVFLCAAVGGWARAALLPKAVDAKPPTWRGRLGALEIIAGLTTLNVLFAAYVLAQLGWFFGGEQFLRERTGLTAAEYARSGFFQMVWVVMLVVPLLIGSRALLPQGRALARRHMLLSLPIVGLLGVMIVSAALRMKLYVHYYGLSTDRFYPLAFMLWLGAVLVWLSVTVLRGWNRPFLAGVAVTAFATLVGLNVSAPDRIVARVNLERVPVLKDSAPVDLFYLARSSGEAADLAVKAVLATSPSALPQNQRDALCRATMKLVDRWGSKSQAYWERDLAAAWRVWNAGKTQALDAVLTNERQLYGQIYASCRDDVAQRYR